MKLYVVTYDGCDESWGTDIYLYGIYDSKEKAEKASTKIGVYGEINEVELNNNKNQRIYLGGYHE